MRLICSQSLKEKLMFNEIKMGIMKRLLKKLLVPIVREVIQEGNKLDNEAMKKIITSELTRCLALAQDL